MRGDLEIYKIEKEREKVNQDQRQKLPFVKNFGEWTSKTLGFQRFRRKQERVREDEKARNEIISQMQLKNLVD